MTKIKDQLDSLLHKEMDRKNFLQYGGTIVLGVLGVTGLVRILLASDKAQPLKTVGVTSVPATGYGTSRYGK